MLRFAQSRLVHASTGIAIPGRNRGSSDAPSTRSRGMSCRQNVRCRVKVTVQHCATALTSPGPGAQLERRNYPLTLSTALSRWLKTVDNFEFASAPGALVSEHAPEFSEAGVSNRAGQTPIAHHAAHIEVLDCDRTEPANQISGSLIEKVLARISDSGVEPCHFEPLPCASPAPVLAPAQDAAGAAQFAQSLVQRLERLDLFTTAQDRQRFQAQIDTDRGLIPGQGSPRLIDSKSDKVAACAVLGYRNSAGSCFYHPRPANPQPADLSEREIAVLLIPVKSRSGKLRTLFITLGPEVRITCAACKEVSIGLLEMPQALLEGYAGDFTQESVLGRPLPLEERGAALAVGGAFASLFEGSASVLQSPIIGPPHTAKELCKRMLLAGGGVKPEAVIDLHKRKTICSKEHYQQKTFTIDPDLKDGVSSLPDERGLRIP